MYQVLNSYFARKVYMKEENNKPILNLTWHIPNKWEKLRKIISRWGYWYQTFKSMKLILAGKNNIAVDVLDYCLKLDIPIHAILVKQNFQK